jgi:8-oxoguanine deaminase
VYDLAGHVVLRGLHTHPHMYQSLTWAVPAAQDAELFGWLKTLNPIWERLTPEMIRVSTLTAMAELILSGCTTSSDHLYVFPGGCRLDDSIEAAGQIGMRFHACRGSMSVGESQGGLPPDSLVGKEPDILADTRRLIEAYHDPSPHAMLRIGVAPARRSRSARAATPPPSRAPTAWGCTPTWRKTPTTSPKAGRASA